MWSEDNPGLNIRDWIYVEDNCRAIWHVAKNGTIGETYNIPGNNEFSNLAITNFILSYFNRGEEMIEKVSHRKGHDFRYSISGEKLSKLGFKYAHPDFNQGLRDTCRWYTENSAWWRPLTK
jgi:dTDP-glucose 4,6-dehydratase